MDESYKKLMDFKYQANLLFAASVLKKKKIPHKTEGDNDFTLLVKLEDYTKALRIIEKLDLDESEVDHDNDGYIEGYKEWADKQYVNGYFTGGAIPRWMHSKEYAGCFGPLVLFVGLLLIIFAAFNTRDLDLTGSLGMLFIASIYTICGALMIAKGFKK